jgi:hypothetical protein
MTTGDDFISLAGRLAAGQNPSPVIHRTVINRAYYGAMHLARQFLASIQVPFDERHNIHFFLCNSGHHEAEEAGKILEGLLDRRMRADYRLERADVESANFAQYAVEMAHEFRSYLDRCHTEPARGAVRSGIEAYRKRTSGGGAA